VHPICCPAAHTREVVESGTPESFAVEPPPELLHEPTPSATRASANINVRRGRAILQDHHDVRKVASRVRKLNCYATALSSTVMNLGESGTRKPEIAFWFLLVVPRSSRRPSRPNDERAASHTALATVTPKLSRSESPLA
jgi:hypothetical protein